MFFLPFSHRLGWVSVIYFLYIFLCTSSSISKWYRKDINISYSCFSRISLLHERVIWVGLPEYICRCFCNEWWGSSGFKQALILWYITFFLLINGLLFHVFREGYGCILWRLRLVSFSIWEKNGNAAMKEWQTGTCLEDWQYLFMDLHIGSLRNWWMLYQLEKMINFSSTSVNNVALFKIELHMLRIMEEDRKGVLKSTCLNFTWLASRSLVVAVRKIRETVNII